MLPVGIGDDPEGVTPYAAGIDGSTLEAGDRLTGFGDRHTLIGDLERALAPGSAPSILALFDLAGLEQYRLALGDPAGDALTARIAAAFREAVGEAGVCYRSREDELATLMAGLRADLRPRLALVERVLGREGEAYLIAPSFGLAQLPDEARDPITALAIADRRLSEVTYRPPSGRRRRPTDLDD